MMLGRWKLFHFQIHGVLLFILMFLFCFHECLTINLEGSALLDFREQVEMDPYEVFGNWKASDINPCMWFGVHCINDEVHMLDLRELSLGGTLAPELGKLSNLRALILCKNNFSGNLPKEIAELTMLELLDLRGNNLSGTIPTEIGQMLSIQHIFLCDNKFQESMPYKFGKLHMLVKQKYYRNTSYNAANAIFCINRKFGDCIWRRKKLMGVPSFMVLQKGIQHFLDILTLFKLRKDPLFIYEGSCYDNPTSLVGSYTLQNSHQKELQPALRVLLQEKLSLPQAEMDNKHPGEDDDIPSLGSGSFPAFADSPNDDQQAFAPALSPKPPSDTKKSNYMYVLPAGAFLTIAAALLRMCRSQTKPFVVRWHAQPNNIAGVPKMSREELEIACEDFSNIIGTVPGCIIYKGTLSNGIEIAVASSCITSSRYWSKHSETLFREKVEMFSRLNHKNNMNIIGYCEEKEPFLRMMVLEYASNGSLFEHLHVKGVEHLDWLSRVRIIMGIAYCLQHMHHEIDPPIVHPNLTSRSIYLSDDFSARIAEFAFWEELVDKGKIAGNDDRNVVSEMLVLNPESNVYSFGVLLLEILSGKIPDDEKGVLVRWAMDNLSDKHGSSYIIDSSLEFIKDNEVDVICEVILACIQQDPRQRPTMQEVANKLKEIIPISPRAAGERISPLLWAELEILEMEAG